MAFMRFSTLFVRKSTAPAAFISLLKIKLNRWIDNQCSEQTSNRFQGRFVYNKAHPFSNVP